MGKVSFGKGLISTYLDGISTHQEMIFFDTINKHIYLSGDNYSDSSHIAFSGTHSATGITGTNVQDCIIQLEGSLSEAVKYTEQTLTDAQKAQARENIGADEERETVQIDLADLAISGDWADIENNPIPEPSASDNGKVLGVTDAQGTLGWVQGGGGGGGSVTSVGLTVPTGLQVTGSPITSSGTLAMSFQTGYSIPTDAKQSGWDAKYDKPSGGIPASDLADGVIQTQVELTTSIINTLWEAA